MNTNTKTRPAPQRQASGRPSTTHAAAAAPDPRGFVTDFDDLSQAEQIVEHLTVPGFMRRIPHRWHLDDISRFGDKVGRVAESMHLAYMTTVDRSLGVLRVFPLPLLKRVYDIMAAQQGWPVILEAETTLALKDAERARDTLRAHEKLAARLREMITETDNTDVLAAAGVLTAWLEAEAQRLRDPATAVAAPSASSGSAGERQG